MSGLFFPANLSHFEAQAVQLDRRDDRSGFVGKASQGPGSFSARCTLLKYKYLTAYLNTNSPSALPLRGDDAYTLDGVVISTARNSKGILLIATYSIFMCHKLECSYVRLHAERHPMCCVFEGTRRPCDVTPRYVKRLP